MAHCKDVYTFLHDANARNDAKLKQFRVKFGPDAYAFYFMVLEMCREEPGYKLSTKYLDGYSHDMNINVERFNILLVAATEIGLLTVQDDYIYSPALLRRMAEYDEKRSKLKANALSRQKDTKADAEQLQSNCIASEYIEQDKNVLRSRSRSKKGHAQKPRPEFVPEAYKLPDDSGGERKAHPVYAALWFSDSEMSRLKKLFAEKGLLEKNFLDPFRIVDAWFSEADEGQKNYPISKCHAKRVASFGLSEALKSQGSPSAYQKNGYSQNTGIRDATKNGALGVTRVPVGIGGSAK